MIEYINVICGVTGAAAAVISCIISFYTYREAQKAQGDHVRKEITSPIESTLSSINEGVILKKEMSDTDNSKLQEQIIIFDNAAKNIIYIGALSFYAAFGITVYFIKKSFIIFSYFRLFSYLLICHSANIVIVTMEKIYTKNVQQFRYEQHDNFFERI